MEGRLRFQIVVDILVDAGEFKDFCEKLGESLPDVVQRLTRDMLASDSVRVPGLEYRLVRGPEIRS